MSITKLSKYDQLLHGIGSVAQLQVQLELNFRRLHTTLCTPSLAMNLSSNKNGIEPLFSECKIMLEKADVSKDVVTIGTKALKEAKDADKKRHRVIHDLWTNKLENSDNTGEFIRYERVKGTINGVKASSHDLEYIIDIKDQLIRSIIRINTLEWVLLDTLPFFKSAGVTPVRSIEESLLIIDDKFDLLPSGGFKARSK